ncbi:MAG: S41 family peptidase [Oscillospiraceae bacterium]|nr:S41 family peptidase [Oscillospiraceae bacterium]
MKKSKLLLLLILLLIISCDTPSNPVEIITETKNATASPEFYEPVETETETANIITEITETSETEAEAFTVEAVTDKITETTEVIETTEPAKIPLFKLPRKPAALSKESLLEDFDYLVCTLEESYPFYGTALRKFKIDLRRQADIARAAVEALDTSKTETQILSEFSGIISTYIVTPMRTMGHLIGLWAKSSRYDVQLALIKLDSGYNIPWYPNLYSGKLDGMFTSPAAVRYYGNPLENVDLDKYIQSTLKTPVPNNVTFDIIVPGSVAYIRMRSMNTANYAYDGELIAAFGKTIGGFDHLIIDLRGNQGGSAENFLRHIVAPLIDMPASLFYYVFFKGGDHCLMFDDIYRRDLQWQLDNGLLLHADASRFPAGEILPYLTEANADDFASLRYGFKRELTVNPAANRWDFEGKIWILIDGGAYSAAEISAALAKESGFATLVGQPTFGSFGGYTAAFIGLPNTGVIIRYDYGYVTDLQGRSLEEFGITPHIYNRSGKDALATVLAVIAESDK